MLNDCFIPFKDVHVGKRAICFGTGPTLEKYKNDIDAIYFGSNEIIYKDYRMDYYFLGDPGSGKRGYLSDEDAYKNYQPNIAKFFRLTMNGTTKGIPEGCDTAKYYTITDNIRKKGTPRDDLENGMGFFATISMEVMQFILYTGIRDILLIGHDCNYNNGSFHVNEKVTGKPGVNLMITAWQKFKKWADEKYPDLSIKIINPVSLKIFKEIKMEEING